MSIQNKTCPCGTNFTSEKEGRGRHPIYCPSCRELKAKNKKNDVQLSDN